jgi:ankyrin repeat protein
VDNNGNTALILACQNGLLDVALALIKTGDSNPNKINNFYRNALQYAQENNLSQVVELL